MNWLRKLFNPCAHKWEEIERYSMAARMDRLRALGNGQVPAVAATAWRLLGGA